ncbi:MULTISPECIES: DUF5983 family protein [Tenebrionibacter/Tenebrionicola group]|jgi:hypothetical protein|nr:MULTISPECIES: DUF5983 family protein [Tenebrionibacter/Tenebrionicola group]
MTVCVEARAASVLPLSNGQLAVDMEGVTLADLVDAINQSGGTLRIADKPGHIVTGTPLPPGASLPGICCSTAHITTDDNRLLYMKKMALLALFYCLYGCLKGLSVRNDTPPGWQKALMG